VLGKGVPEREEEESERVGDNEDPRDEGVLDPKRLVASSEREWRVEGVLGNRMELFDGVPGLDVTEPEATGKGTANNGFRGEERFEGDFEGDRDGDEGV
jgi:hypothetical protein